MKKSIYKQKVGIQFSKSFLMSLALFVGILVFISIGINRLGSGNKKEELEIAKDSINKAIMSCYAIEGKYPSSYEYLEDNYGVHVNQKKYIVSYEIFGSNIFPNVLVVER